MAVSKGANRILFEAEVTRHEDLITTLPIEQGVLTQSLISLENAGTNMLTGVNDDARFFADTMHGAYRQLADIEVVPPFTEQQQNMFIGKVTVYSSLMESFSKKRKQTKATDTEGTKTDDRKQ